jgi:hypothetical protein
MWGDSQHSASGTGQLQPLALRFCEAHARQEQKTKWHAHATRDGRWVAQGAHRCPCGGIRATGARAASGGVPPEGSGRPRGARQPVRRGGAPGAVVSRLEGGATRGAPGGGVPLGPVRGGRALGARGLRGTLRAVPPAAHSRLARPTQTHRSVGPSSTGRVWGHRNPGAHQGRGQARGVGAAHTSHQHVPRAHDRSPRQLQGGRFSPGVNIRHHSGGDEACSVGCDAKGYGNGYGGSRGRVVAVVQPTPRHAVGG